MDSQRIADYTFDGGFPTAETIERVYDDADLNRAIQAYRFFYPAVSLYATWKATLAAGAVPNRVFTILRGSPRQVVLTPSSDTPYACLPLDLRSGPIVVEVPPGPLVGVVNDLYQRYVMDLGVPGPDKGAGGTHVIVPPDHRGPLLEDAFTGYPATNRVMLLVRAIPPHGDVDAAIALMRQVHIGPLDGDVVDPQWVDLSEREVDLSIGPIETTLEFWAMLHDLIDREPLLAEYHDHYGELAALGIAKGLPFRPDERTARILARAAEVGNAQLRVQSFADRRPDRVMWRDRQWEWASLRPETGDFETPAYKDLEAREKWFYQAAIESPAMFRRQPGGGSLYWLGLRDADGAYLDGGRSYRLTVPLPVPAGLFWSITVYDPLTRSELQTAQGRAALRSQFELAGAPERGVSIDLYFGPEPPAAGSTRWLQTVPHRGWFAYFRIYGPRPAAFDGSWKLGDFVNT